ncbi:hypothetical protein F5X68DRAFT_197584 [Plectosphaerella plurivora]|uniref:Dockerin type 1 n=1 Tax=Plectosphaerella plurivora TaxID=936078 RepID=A0A9P9ADG8_9PEZI|nr:hypothetical protein F5X68DRAFT_197584 [Plectosphaerella plurivora]
MTRSLLTLALCLQALSGSRAAPCSGTRVRPTRTEIQTVTRSIFEPTSSAFEATPTPDLDVLPSAPIRDEVPADIIRDVVPTSIFDPPAVSSFLPTSTPARFDDATPVAEAVGPATFTANPNVGPGGSDFKDSAHFRVYGNAANADAALAMLEGAYECFVDTLGFRSSGLSYNQNNDDGPFYKTNIYSVNNLPGAAGVMQADMEAGLAYVEVLDEYLANPGVTVHEFGHALHFHQQTWVHQGRTGAWWETFANWIADTYKTSDLCAAARTNNGQTTSNTEIELRKTIGDSFQPLVDGTPDSGNYYQAWPFFAYLTNNPDQLTGLGTDVMHQLMLQYEPNSNETPLHTLARVSTNASVAEIVGNYWARMAYVDIGHAAAHEVFLAEQGRLNYDNVDGSGSTYTVKAARRPQYMGANIIPLTATAGTVSVQLTAVAPHTATLAVLASGGQTRYVPVDGSASVDVASGDQVSLVVANTPELVLFDAFALTDEIRQPLDYSFTLTGATA